MHVFISKCIQNVPTALRIFTRESATLVTTINRSDKLYQNASDYIKMNTLCAREGQKCTKFFFSEKRHDLSQLLIVVKRH